MSKAKKVFMGDRWLCSKEAAQYVGRSIKTVYRAVERGDLRASRPSLPKGNVVGKRRGTTDFRFKLTWLDDWQMGKTGQKRAA